jgi:hypothetical protein
VSSKPNCSGTNSICGVKPAAQDVWICAMILRFYLHF